MTIVTAVECISADGRALLPLIIWPASIHRSNWTTHPTPRWDYGSSDNGYNDAKTSSLLNAVFIGQVVPCRLPTFEPSSITYDGSKTDRKTTATYQIA